MLPNLCGPHHTPVPPPFLLHPLPHFHPSHFDFFLMPRMANLMPFFIHQGKKFAGNWARCPGSKRSSQSPSEKDGHFPRFVQKAHEGPGADEGEEESDSGEEGESEEEDSENAAGALVKTPANQGTSSSSSSEARPPNLSTNLIDQFRNATSGQVGAASGQGEGAPGNFTRKFPAHTTHLGIHLQRTPTQTALLPCLPCSQTLLSNSSSCYHRRS